MAQIYGYGGHTVVQHEPAGQFMILLILCVFSCVFCVSMSADARMARLVVRIKAWLRSQGLKLHATNEWEMVAKACVEAGIETARDWNGLKVCRRTQESIM